MSAISLVNCKTGFEYAYSILLFTVSKVTGTFQNVFTLNVMCIDFLFCMYIYAPLACWVPSVLQMVESFRVGSGK